MGIHNSNVFDLFDTCSPCFHAVLTLEGHGRRRPTDPGFKVLFEMLECACVHQVVTICRDRSAFHGRSALGAVGDAGAPTEYTNTW